MSIMPSCQMNFYEGEAAMIELCMKSVSFVFPNEGNYKVEVDKSLLFEFSKKKFADEEKIKAFPSHYLNLAIIHLRNPEKELNFGETDRVYEAAYHLELVKLKDRIVKYVTEVFPNKEWLQQQLILSESESRKDLYSRSVKVYCQKNNDQWSLSYLFSPVSYSANYVWGSASGIVNSIYNVFCDGDHEWKDFRYATVLSQHIKCYGLEDLKNEKVLISVAHPLISLEGSSRERYKKFIISFRKAYQEGVEKEWLQIMAIQHFTEITCLNFLTQACLFLALKQNPCFFSKVFYSKEILFSEKCLLLKGAIDKVDKSLTKPISHTLCNKAEKLLPGFDSLAKNNMPWKFLEVTFSHKDFGSRSIGFIRSGVPVNDEGIVPEFLAFVEGLKFKKKKIAVIVHLNPKFFDTKTLVAQEESYDLQKVSRRESKWIEKIVGMEKLFSGTMEVFVLPFDGKWIKKLEDETPFTLDEMKKYLLEEIFTKGTLFLFSQSIRENEELLKEETEKLLDQVVAAHYYDKETHALLSKEEKMAFLALFYHDFTHYYALKLECDVVMSHCTDGRDRTGIQLLTFAAKLHSLKKLQMEEMCRIIGTGIGPAVVLAKEAPHPHRWPYMLAVLKQLEKAPAKELFCRGQGWMVKNFLFPEDADQTLIPGPSETLTLKEYQLRMKEEKEFPFVLPQKMAIKSLQSQMSGIEKKEFLKQFDLDLKAHKIFFGTQRLEIKDGISFEKEFLEQACQLKDESLRNQILFFLTEMALIPVLSILKERYNNTKLELELFSNSLEKSMKWRTEIHLIEDSLEFSTIKKFPVCDTKNSEQIGCIEMKMQVKFDTKEKVFIPLVGWKVL